jgi:hypothetical protein
LLRRLGFQKDALILKEMTQIFLRKMLLNQDLF